MSRGSAIDWSRAASASWQSHADGPGEVVQQALQHFRQEEFFYTLAPPRVVENPADQFLFETRSGFCEHYATSFVLLMRIAAIPSRVVTGYQGGECNTDGDYLIVRQSDAHAWAEVWLEGKGWVRVDPTAAVAPERVEHWLDPDRLVQGDRQQPRSPRPGEYEADVSTRKGAPATPKPPFSPGRIRPALPS